MVQGTKANCPPFHVQPIGVVKKDSDSKDRHESRHSSDSSQVCGTVELGGEVFSSPVAWWDETDETLRIAVGCRDNHVYCLKFEAS